MADSLSGVLVTSSWLAAFLGFVLFSAPAWGKEAAAGVKWKEPIQVASGDAYQGPWRMNESEFNYVDDPTVAINEEGAVAVAWTDQSRQDIFLQVYETNGGKRFTQPVNVSKSPEIFSWLPRMIFPSTDPGRIYVLWQEIVFSGGTHGGEIFFARSTDGGKTFSKPKNLSNTIAGAGKGRLTKDYWHNGSLDIALGPEGNLFAVWTEYEGALRLSRSADGGVTFSDPVRIWGGENANPARGPSLSAASGGEISVAWTVGEDESADIHFAKSTDYGASFGAPRIVAPSEGHADAPKIAVDGKGTVHLVYAESPGGLLARYHIRYSRLEKGEGKFESPREIAGPAKRWKSMNFPGLTLDGKNNLYILWELFPRPISYPQGFGFTYSKDGGRTFAPPLNIPGTVDPEFGGGGRQGLLMKKIAVNSKGEIAVVNSTFKKNEESSIWLIRGQAAWR